MKSLKELSEMSKDELLNELILLECYTNNIKRILTYKTLDGIIESKNGDKL